MTRNGLVTFIGAGDDQSPPPRRSPELVERLARQRLLQHGPGNGPHLGDGSSTARYSDQTVITLLSRGTFLSVSRTRHHPIGLWALRLARSDRSALPRAAPDRHRGGMGNTRESGRRPSPTPRSTP